MSSNLGWLFYKDYFQGIDYADLENENNKTLIQAKVQNIINQSVTIEKDKMLGNTHFKATTTYPGLILGSGNAHELPSIEGQAILGFHFDYTSGLPVIQGSSIKGVLKSAFKHPEYIRELLKDENINVKELEGEIFDNGDVFFDAMIISNGKILGDDYLAPHDEDGLKNPIPLRFIKVLPNVSFRFDFELSSGLISKSKKFDLFKSILEDLGLGAKTNVGYGKFTNFQKLQTAEEKKLEAKERENERLRDAKEAESLDTLEQFKRDFPNNTEIDVLIIEFKADEKKRDIQRAFDNLDKKNKRFVDSFIKKYKDNPDAQQFIEQLNVPTEKANQKNVSGTIKNDKELKKFLESLQPIEDETKKKQVEESILQLCEGFNKKKKEQLFRKAKIEKYVSEDFYKQLKDKVGL